MTEFAQLTQDLHAHRTRSPQKRLMLGLLEGIGDLPDPSLEARDARVEAAQALLARLATIDRSALDPHARLDAELARLLLEEEVFLDTVTVGEDRVAELKPEAGDTIGDGIFLLFVSDPRPLARRLEDITTRLEQVPPFLVRMLARLRRPVARWVAIELETLSGLPELFATVEAAAADFAGLPRLSAARARAERAIADYSERLGRMETRAELAIGADAVGRLLRLRGIGPTALELREIARQFLVENAETVESLRVRLVEKYGLAPDSSAEQLHSFLNERFKVQIRPGQLEDVLLRYEEARAGVLDFVQARGLFPIPEAQDMVIMRTPSFMAPSIPAGAMMPPPAFRGGVATSLVYLTLSDELLDEHNTLGIPMMMVHEGIPGHHLQLSHAAAHPSIVRRHFDSLDLAEGWTTMLEDYMLDVGFQAELKDEVRFIAKRDIARLGARVAIDLFFMTGDRQFLDVGVDVDLSSADPFVAAGNLLQAVTGFTAGRVQAELNWYSRERGYPLSYLAGNHAMWALKRDVAAAQAGRLDGLDLDRRFHEIVLGAGNMPVTALRQVFQIEGLLPA